MTNNELWKIRGRGKSLFSQDVVKLFHTGFKPYVCAECGKELFLPLSELKKLCLLSESDLKNNEFKGLCPECTRKWLEKQKEVDRGKKASFVIIDELYQKNRNALGLF